MKKVVFYLLVGLMACSCNTDDGANGQTDVAQTMIGEWNLNRRAINGELESLEICERFTTLEFFENNDFSIILFIGDEPENCQSATGTGSWEYLGSDKISIHMDGQAEAAMLRVSFSNNHNTMLLTELEGDEIVGIEEYVR